MTTNPRRMRYAIVTNPGEATPRYAVPTTLGTLDRTERLTDAQSFPDAAAAAISAEAYGLTMWHLVGIGLDFEPVPLCSYCDDEPLTDGGPYCVDCLDRFYGPSEG